MFHSASVCKILIWPVLVMGYFVSGCSSTSEIFREDLTDGKGTADYSVIYYIHSDSDYLYHGKEGEPVQGNSKVLDTAFRIAEEAKSGEIFIFFQSPERKILGLFQRRSSRLYHYTNGELTSQVKYRHSDKNENFLTTEARLFDQYRTQSMVDNRQNYFLFYGHEIPDYQGKKYHRTLPDIAVNTWSFSKGIQKFLVTDEQRFDLVVLSTCNNGTPVMAEHLMPFSDVMLASPQNLHLSHIDSDLLGLLESNPGISSIQLAHSMADQTYRRLDSETETTITLTVYDFEIVRERKNDLQAFARQYDSLGSMQYFSDNIDCKQVVYFDDETFGEGLTIWFKPARFGRQSLTNTHSGWGCKPHTEDAHSL
ncbi:MAG: hypothetical protein EA359_00850 [Balneolaceae bacterium]|nr:MAG: hypothetical protein EA359_00850 [Balneolaceae bacterium]